MRRLCYTLVAASLLTVQQAQAQSQLQCLAPEERSAVEVAALRSQLMVLAMGCSADQRYNEFVRKYQVDLQGNDRAVGDMFKRKYGKRGQQEHDRFTTDLANGESSAGMRLGSDFCDRNGMLFAEVMSLRSASDLPSYAAAKDLVPATLEVCPAPAKAPAAPVRKASASSTTKR